MRHGHHRWQMREIIEASEDDVTPKLSVMLAMRMSNAAWMSVSATTVKNCRKKGGFLQEPQEEEEIPPPSGMNEGEFNVY